MQCPPSPLLFDPSLTLEDCSVKEIAEGPVDILASEEQPQPSFTHIVTQPGRDSLLALPNMHSQGEGLSSQVDCKGTPEGSSADGLLGHLMAPGSHISAEHKFSSLTRKG